MYLAYALKIGAEAFPVQMSVSLIKSKYFKHQTMLRELEIEVHVKLILAVFGGFILGLSVASLLDILAHYNVNPQNIPSLGRLIRHVLAPSAIGLFLVFMAFIFKFKFSLSK